MTRIRFEDLPSTNTPRNAENLNKLNNVVISPTEPITGEEVWIDNVNKKIYTKNDNGVYEEFYKNNGIVESGSNANGNYVKFADGTLIQRGKITKNVAIQSVWEGTNWYEGYITDIINFPISFLDNDFNISITNRTSNGLWIEGVQANKSSITAIVLARPNSSVEKTYTLDYTAIGKWK